MPNDQPAAAFAFPRTSLLVALDTGKGCLESGQSKDDDGVTRLVGDVRVIPKMMDLRGVSTLTGKEIFAKLVMVESP